MSSTTVKSKTSATNRNFTARATGLLLGLLCTALATSLSTQTAHAQTTPAPAQIQTQPTQATAIVATPLHRPAAVAPLLETTPVGESAGQAWVTRDALFENPATKQWIQLLIKKESRGAREFVVSALNLTTGKIDDLGTYKGYGFSKSIWVKGKFYFTTWLPGGFYCYDPATNTITRLPDAFKTEGVGAFRLAATSTGVLVLGAGPGTEVSTYDTSTGKLTQYGPLSTEHSYVYTMGIDDRYIYAGLRSKSPWRLVCIDMTTGEQKNLIETSNEGYIRISGTNIRVTDKINVNEWKHYKAQGMSLIPVDPPATQPAATPAAEAPAPLPSVVIDETPLLEGKDKLEIHFQDPANREVWKSALYPATVAAENIADAAVMADGRIVSLTGPYNPALLYNPKTGESIQAPFSPLSGRAITSVGTVAYGTGYPSTTLIGWDTAKPQPKISNPAGKATYDWSSPTANPRLLAYYPMSTSSGGHLGYLITPAADGTIFISTTRHRHNLGFDIVWYDPKNQTKGEVEDAGQNDHQFLGWSSPMDNGKKLLVATTIQPNRQLTTPEPDQARVCIVDMLSRKYIDSFNPVPGTKTYAGTVEVSPGVIVGIAVSADNQCHLYKYDTNTHKLIDKKQYAGIIHNSLHYDYTLGPDGHIWTCMNVAAEQFTYLRIDPATLDIQIVGRISQPGKLLFTNETVYITGSTKLREVPLFAKIISEAKKQALAKPDGPVHDTVKTSSVRNNP